MRYRALVPAASLLLACGALWLWSTVAIGPDPLGTSTLASTLSMASAGQEPTAVVLGDFSASIQGPSSALWSLSIALIIIGALIVQYRYRNY